ncbi:MAG: GntR family transcriptional regulator [Clostridiales bacterium]|nr:GntR family transcriptional regulator [Clostridiales bacterium]
MKEFASIMLNKQSDVPVYRQLGDAFCQLIQSGVLPPHKKLPPIRTMARGLRINNDTVINAYKYMENQGAAYSVVGSGTYVSDISRIPREPEKIFLNEDKTGAADDIFPAEAVRKYLKNKTQSSTASIAAVFGFFCERNP